MTRGTGLPTCSVSVTVSSISTRSLLILTDSPKVGFLFRITSVKQSQAPGFKVEEIINLFVDSRDGNGFWLPFKVYAVWAQFCCPVDQSCFWESKEVQVDVLVRTRESIYLIKTNDLSVCFSTGTISRPRWER